MKYFSATIEAGLLTSAESNQDSQTLTFSQSFWSAMVERSRYVSARHAGRAILGQIKNR